MHEAFGEALARGRHEHGGWQNGAVLELTAAGSPEVGYLVGDVHAKLSRLEAVYRQVAEELDQERAVLIFLGDLFHREEDERAGEMDSSVATFRRFMELKQRHPRHLYALLGNHEFTRTGRVKRGYFQGDLFRAALETAGLYSTYRAFLSSAPLVALHPACAAVHAAPTEGVDSLADLRALQADDLEADSLDPRVVALTCHRHRDWAPRAERAYTDRDVDRFLRVCGVQGPLITGHTPLCRDTDWTWQLGPRNHVIFAAGRELGIVRADPAGVRFMRLGRSHPEDDDRLVEDRTPVPLPPLAGGCSWVEGPSPYVCVSEAPEPVQLWPDVRYRFLHGRKPWRLGGGGPTPLQILSFGQLTTASSYYGPGHYLVADEARLQLARLATNEAILVGSHLRIGGPWPLREPECLILRHGDAGQFEVQALVDGLWIQDA